MEVGNFHSGNSTFPRASGDTTSTLVVNILLPPQGIPSGGDALSHLNSCGKERVKGLLGKSISS